MRWSSVFLDATKLLFERTELLLRGKPTRRYGIYSDPSRMPVEVPSRPGRLDEGEAPRRLITICAWCNKIRNNQGVWRQPQADLQAHRYPEFTHGICPACAEQSYNVSQYRNAGLHATSA
jgi:hypothetical protein